VRGRADCVRVRASAQAPMVCQVISWTLEWPALCHTFPQDGAGSSLRRNSAAVQGQCDGAGNRSKSDGRLNADREENVACRQPARRGSQRPLVYAKTDARGIEGQPRIARTRAAAPAAPAVPNSKRVAVERGAGARAHDRRWSMTCQHLWTGYARDTASAHVSTAQVTAL
jgi:hypothetical protein